MFRRNWEFLSITSINKLHYSPFVHCSYTSKHPGVPWAAATPPLPPLPLICLCSVPSSEVITPFTSLSANTDQLSTTHPNSLFLISGDFNCHHANWPATGTSHQPWHCRKGLNWLRTWAWINLLTFWHGFLPMANPAFRTWWWWPTFPLMSPVLPLLQLVCLIMCLWESTSLWIFSEPPHSQWVG